MTPEEQKQALLADIKKQVGDELNTRGFQSKADVDAIVAEKIKDLQGLDLAGLRALSTEEGGIKGIMEAMSAKIKAIEEAAATRQPQDLSIRSQVAKWMEDNKDAIQRGDKNLPGLEIRVAANPMTVATVNTGASTYLPRAGVAPGVNDLNRTKPTFWNRLTKGSTRLNPYVWVNKTNKQGNATFIGEGVLKPLASFELATESSVAKKVAERMRVSRELLYDVDGMTSMIENELRFEVEVAANTASLTGTASSTSPAGITTLATAYTLTTVETTYPNNLDAIRAAMVQLQLLNFDRQIEAFINPIDAANMDLAKGDDGHYVLPPFTTSNGQSIKGLTLIEDNNIAQGYLLIGDMSKYKILMYQPFFIEWGFDSDDFSKNLITVIGEMRFHQFFGANDAGAFIYDTFENIKTAIDATV